MAAAALPDWFAHDCGDSLGHGLQLVEIQRHAEDSGLSGRILINDDGRIWIPASDYRLWTGQEPPPTPPRVTTDGEWLPLGAVAHHADACRSRLQIAGRIPPSRYSTRNGNSNVSALSPDLGAVLNLDLFSYTSPSQGASLHALTELGASTSVGYWRTRQLFQPDGSRRLDSQLRHDLTGRGESLVLGDQLSGDGLAGSVLFGGLSWGSDFSQRPELARYPLPVLAGDAVLSSVAELYVDGRLRQRERLPPGPYLLEPLLTPQGFGEIQVITHDALGRETRLSQPFYVSPRLLRAGLDEYRINAGRLRLGMGSDEDRYGDGFASADWRRGLNDQLTASVHANAMAKRQALRGEVLASRPDSGLSGITAGISRDHDAGNGYQIGLSQEWLSRNTSLQGSWSHASRAYAELGREPGAIASRASLQASLRLSGNLQTSAGWLHEERRTQDDLALYNLALQWQPAPGSQWVLSATGLPGTGWTRSISLFQTLAGRQSMAVQLQQDADGDLSGLLQWSWQPAEHPWSLRAELADDSRSRSTRISALYNGPSGTGGLGVLDSDDGRSLQGSLSTSLAWVPGNLFWGRRLNDSFIVIDTGEPGITLYRNHQIVGRTDARGQMLISDLQPYHPALLSLSADELPMDVQPGRLEQFVRPPRGVAHIDWRLTTGAHMASWHARLDDGSMLPAASDIDRGSQRADLPSGRDGLLYLPADWAGSTLDISLLDGRLCRIAQLPAADSATEVICALQP